MNITNLTTNRFVIEIKRYISVGKLQFYANGFIGPCYYIINKITN